MTTVVEARNLTKRFGSVRAVDGVSFRIEEHRIYGLLGRNGAGKTTLMSLLTGQEFATGGEIEVFGTSPVENAGVLEQVCFIKESQKYPDDFKVKHVLRTAPWFFPNWDQEFADRLVKDFRLPLDRRMKKVSRGQFSAVGVVVGLASRAPLTFFDEPYLGLDAVARQLFYDRLLEDYAEHPRTVILSTHLIDEVSDLLEHVLVIDEGKLLVDSPADELRGSATTVVGGREAVEKFLAGARDPAPRRRRRSRVDHRRRAQRVRTRRRAGRRARARQGLPAATRGASHHGNRHRFRRGEERMSAITPTSTPTPRPLARRLWNVIRLHLANPFTILGTPLLIMGLIFVVNWVIWLLVRMNTPDNPQSVEDVSIGFQYSGASLWAFVYMMVVAIMAMNLTFSFALGFGSTRRDFSLGTGVTFVGLSAFYALLYTGLAADRERRPTAGASAARCSTASTSASTGTGGCACSTSSPRSCSSSRSERCSARSTCAPGRAGSSCSSPR